MSKDYPGFHDWTVDYSTGPNGRHQFDFIKEHPAGKNGKLTVTATIGAEKDPEIAYLAGKRDALAEDLRVANPDDAQLWADRHADAHREVAISKVHRHVAKMKERDDTPADIQSYVVEAMTKAGFSLTEIAKMVEG